MTESQGQAATVPHDVHQDYTDEQLAGGIRQLRAVRASLGDAASDETICGVIYDGMMAPLRRATPPPLGAAAGQDALQRQRMINEARYLNVTMIGAHPADVWKLLRDMACELESLTRTPSPSEAQPVAWIAQEGRTREVFFDKDVAERWAQKLSGEVTVTPLYAHPAPSPSEGVREAHERLSRLEHVVWHLLDDNGDGDEGIVGVTKDDVWLVKLNALLPDEHFDLLVEQDARAALASSTVEKTLGGEE